MAMVCYTDWKFVKAGRYGQARNLLKYLQYRDDAINHIPRAGGPQRWVDCGLGGSWREILDAAADLQSRKVLMRTLVIRPPQDLVAQLKEVDPALHQELTGVSSERILDNLVRLARSGKPLIVRRPVIPGYNDSAESIHRLARFVRELGIKEINLLPYHRMGEGKYDRLDQEYALRGRPSLKEEDVGGLRDILLSYGFRAKIGG